MDSEFIKLANAPAWASSGTTLELTSSTPPINRVDGLGTQYSLESGTQIDYRSMNQILLELSSAAKEIVNGISEWNVSVPYKIGSITKRNNALYIALQDNTGFQPGSADTHWKRVGAVTNQAPDTPTDPSWSNAKALTLVLTWRNGADNGSFSNYRMRWRKTSATNFSSWTTLNYARHEFTGLSSGDRLVVEVQARGSGYSGTLTTTTPPALAVRTTAPEGGNAIGLLSSAGNARVDLEWTAPTNNGGSPITGYLVQYKSGTQIYSTARQLRLAPATKYTVTGLTNGTAYTFRVAAVNAVGASEWSNDSSATPTATPQVGNFGRLDAPTLVRYSTANDPLHQTLIYGSTNIVPDPNEPTFVTTAIQWRYRKDGERAWRQQTTKPSEQFKAQGIDAGWWNVIYRVITTSGRSGWSGVGRIEVGTEVPPPPRVTITYDRKTGRVKAYVTVASDGGARLTRIRLRFDYNRPGVSNPIDSYSLNTNLRSYQSSTISLINSTMRSLYISNDNRVSQVWVPNRRRDGDEVTVFVSATNHRGEGDWREGNTLQWEDVR